MITPIQPDADLETSAASESGESCSGEPEGDSELQSPLASVHPELRAALKRRGFDTLTSVQSAVLEACRAPRDLQISSQTGSGKTVALGFVIARPWLEAGSNAELTDPVGPRALVIVPTRELAAQVREELTWLFDGISNVRVDCVTGGTSVLHDRDRLRRKPAVLVGTPGRLLDHIKSGSLDASDVRELVLDEADQMLDMGFREELESILEATPTDRRTHLASATFPQAIANLAKRYQNDPLSIEGTKLGAANEDIVHVAHLVHDRDRYSALVNLLMISGEERALVFVKTRAATSELAEKLCEDGFTAAALSGELAQSQRTATLRAFRSGTVSILVATDVAARGLDIPDVATVIHGDLAFDAEAYTHRSGRTGRAGKQGHSVSLVSVRKERQARRTFQYARVQVDWRDAPGRKPVLKVLKKRERRRLWEALAKAPEPEAGLVELAQRLLETGDPEHVVATLLSELRPSNQIEPRDIGAPRPRDTRDARDNWHGDRNSRSNDRPYGRPSYGNSDGGYSGGPKHNASFSDRRASRENGHFVRFSINWGFEGGATPKRILAHICRRGGISGQEVGAIRLDPRMSFFDVDGRLASDFADRVRQPDSRDPKLRIYRVPSRN